MERERERQAGGAGGGRRQDWNRQGGRTLDSEQRRMKGVRSKDLCSGQERRQQQGLGCAQVASAIQRLKGSLAEKVRLGVCFWQIADLLSFSCKMSLGGFFKSLDFSVLFSLTRLYLPAQSEC